MVKGKVQLFQGALQMILSHLDRVDAEKVDLADFLPHTEQDVSKLYERLRGFLLKLSNPHLRALVECFLMDEDFVRAFCRSPAGVRNHHAYLGGLLEHVVTLLDAADRLLPLYPDLDRDLLLTGVFLHDIGKVRELSFDRAFAYTDEGQLVGHLVIGVEMLNEKVRQRAGPDRRAVPARTAVAAQAHDPEPSRHLRVRQPEIADDAGGRSRCTTWTTSTPRCTASRATSATTATPRRRGRRSTSRCSGGCSRAAPARRRTRPRRIPWSKN